MADARGAVEIGNELVMDLGAWGTRTNVLSCPGCWSWQLDYTNAVSMLWITQRMTHKGGRFVPVVDTSVWDQMIEDILREHVARECTAPQLVLALLKERGEA